MAGKREWARKVKTYQIPPELFTERPSPCRILLPVLTGVTF